MFFIVRDILNGNIGVYDILMYIEFEILVN